MQPTASGHFGDLRSNMKSIAAKTGDLLGDQPLRLADSVFARHRCYEKRCLALKSLVMSSTSLMSFMMSKLMLKD